MLAYAAVETMGSADADLPVKHSISASMEAFPLWRLVAAAMVICLLAVSGHAAAQAACNPGAGVSTIGSEFFAVVDHNDGTFDYNANLISCSGGVVNDLLTTTFTGTPAAVLASPHTNLSRIFKNTCGTHITFVHDNYSGTVAGVSLSLASFPKPGTYADVFVNQLIDGAITIPCPVAPSSCTGITNLPPGASACAAAVQDKESCSSCNDPRAVVAPMVGNPIYFGRGRKIENATDYAAEGPSPLRFMRHYDSQSPFQSARAQVPALGNRWIHNYALQLLQIDASNVALSRGDGRILYFHPQSGNLWVGDADVNDRLTKSGSNWLYLNDNDALEQYNGTGQLTSITLRTGVALNFTYVSGKLTQVQDSFGRALGFAYTGLQLTQITDPAGLHITYGYDVNQSLATVTYQDTKQRQYQYTSLTVGGVLQPALLTDLIDENGAGFAHWGYNATTGLANLSQHAGPVEQYSLTYTLSGGIPTSTVVTDPLGTQHTFGLNTLLGVNRPGAETNAALAKTHSQAYDANANIAATLDYNTNQTCYSYDLARNLEIKRVEGLPSSAVCSTALATPPAPTTANPVRTTNTQWHGVWRLPVKVAEPLKLTTYVYNGDTYNSAVVTCAPPGATVPTSTGTQPIGVLCQQIEQATTDATGSQGFSATASGNPRIWSTTYNAQGQVLTRNGPRTDVTDLTTYAYYPATTATHTLGDLSSVTDALGHVTQITAYDLNGRPLTVIDPNSVTLSFTYFPRGWLKTSSVAAAITTYAYDNVGQLTSVTRPDASKTSYGYDAAHRLTSITDLKGNQVSFTLDAIGNITSTAWINPDSSTAKSQSATYDALGRLRTAIETRNAVNFTTTFGYDANGNPTTLTDPKTKLTSTAYDALNRSTQVTDALSGLTTLAYDARGQLTQLKAPNNAQTSFTVDGLGNVGAEASADRGSLSATYDAAGNLLTLSDARGIVETHTWDALNRPLTVTYPTTGENLAYTWDSGCSNGIGRLCQITDNGGSTAYAYDVRGNPLTKTRTEAGGSFTTSFTYDSADRVATLITPTNKILTTQRDTDGRIQQVSTAVAGTNTNLVSAVQTNAAGNTTAQTYGNGVTEARTFNTDGSVANQSDTTPGGGGGDADVPTLPEWGAIIMAILLLVIGYRQQRQRMGSGLVGAVLLSVIALSCFSTSPVWADEALTYDANGNVQTRTLPGGTTTYGVDDLNRINSEAGPAKTQSLTYDANDNRLSDGSGSKTYTANTDRIVTENGVSFTLDAAGNVTNARGYVYVWNQAGQLKSVSQGATLLATYFYDYEGHRSRKVTTAAAPQGAQTVIYHYDLQDHLIAETTPTATPLVTYVWRDDIPVSIIVAGSPEKALYLETDHLGTPIVARNQAGTIVWKWESDAFGTTLPNDDPGSTGIHTTINLRFPGQYFDRESGLHYNYHRYYDPKLGRYMSPDPIGLAGGINPYQYALSNPLRYTDPTGLFADKLLLGAIIVGGVVIASGWKPPAVHNSSSSSNDPLGSDGASSSSSSSSSSGNTCKPDHDNECRLHLLEDEAACVVPIIRYGYTRGSVCLRSAMTRYGECLRFGPSGITTPLHGVDTPL